MKNKWIELFSVYFKISRLPFTKVLTVIKYPIIVGIVVLLFWISSSALPIHTFIEPTQTPAITHLSRNTITFTSTTPLPIKTATKLITPTSTKILSPTPIYDSPEEYNFDFEHLSGGWVISSSNTYFIGGPSQEWTSHGEWSFKLSHFKNDPSCSIYAYPSDFVQITQRVDLSNVTAIVVDLKCITCSLWGDVRRDLYLDLRVDKKPIDTIYEITNELSSRKIQINNMNGSHLLTIRFGTSNESCFVPEVGVYVDNIRFIYSTSTLTPTP